MMRKMSQNDVAKLSAKNLGNYAFDIIRLSEQNEEMYETFKRKVKNEIGSMDGKDCYRILKSLEINNKLYEREEDELLKIILNQICTQGCKYSMKEICDISFLCSRLNIIFIPLFASLSLAFLNKINLATPENISVICLSFCKVQIKDINLFNRITVATLNLLHLFDVESLINVLISLSYLDIKKDMLLHSSVDIFVKNKDKLDADQLVKVAHIYSKFFFINNDINTILRDKLPLYISQLNNVQLSELVISLNKLCLTNTYAINKFFPNVNLLQLRFPIAIKVMNVLPRVNNINIEFKYDEILLCVHNFLFIYGSTCKHLNDKRNMKLFENFQISRSAKSGNVDILGSLSSEDNWELNGVNGRGAHCDEARYYRVRYSDVPGEHSNGSCIPGESAISSYGCSGGNKLKSSFTKDDVLSEQFAHLHVKEKLSPTSICLLNVDVFECLCNLLGKNRINDDYERKIKSYIRCICKEIIFLKDYINFDSLIKIFSSLLKIPIVWSLPFLQLDIIKSVSNKFLFYIDEEINFYEELLRRYFTIFSTSKDVEKHSPILCFIINLFKLREEKEFCMELEKCLQWYSYLRRDRNNLEGDVTYMMEDYSIYNFIDYYYKNIPLWSNYKSEQNSFQIGSNIVVPFSEYDNADTVIFPYALKNSMVNKIIPLELYSIVNKFTKNITVNFKDGMYYIPLFEYDNYIAYIFLGPEEYYYSPIEKKELSFVREALQGKSKLKGDNTGKYVQNSLLLINDTLYNPYDTFYNDNYFIKPEGAADKFASDLRKPIRTLLSNIYEHTNKQSNILKIFLFTMLYKIPEFVLSQRGEIGIVKGHKDQQGKLNIDLSYNGDGNNGISLQLDENIEAQDTPVIILLPTDEASPSELYENYLKETEDPTHTSIKNVLSNIVNAFEPVRLLGEKNKETPTDIYGEREREKKRHIERRI
ncbi:conserved Plasmodium protein, unknown function [Plasmodium ovale curtisi]|uniref:Uncharacterized protein n=1 Tax=Plasmodium ovale curtisi TaxID=864141 RepID=A0A1A8VSM0_PLAOA|nr:conserved Plasmodium protein, unknown function [Plasmodium ovale curtisi]